MNIPALSATPTRRLARIAGILQTVGAATVLMLLFGQLAAAAGTPNRVQALGADHDDNVEFERTLSAWEVYRSPIVGAFSLVAAQMLLIGWLLVEHRQRRRAEAAVRQCLQEAHTQFVTIAHLDRRAAMGEVTAAIAHELNQPLEAILHNAKAGEMMLDSGVASNGDVRQIFEDIGRIDERAATIIHRLRGFLCKGEFEKRPVGITEVVREAAALVMPVAGSRGVRVEFDLAGDSIAVAGDRIHLQQVLLNLMLNSIEAMSATPPERRRLTIGTMTGDHQVEISVRDGGCGIRAERVSQIFEPFYTTKGEGMGIGLSIARTIVEAHGGRIAASNNANGGATICFTLPASAVVVPPPSATDVRPFFDAEKGVKTLRTVARERAIHSRFM